MQWKRTLVAALDENVELIFIRQRKFHEFSNVTDSAYEKGSHQSEEAGLFHALTYTGNAEDEPSILVDVGVW